MTSYPNYLPMCVERVQHAVGQGFFHSGTLEVSMTRLTWVVDCGTTSDPERVLAELEALPSIDMLVLSHLHADHVSGVPDLLRPNRRRRRAQVVMLPYTSMEERLVIFAASVLEDRALLRNSNYRAFMENPVAFLLENTGGRIILVRSGENEIGRAGDEEPEQEPDPDRGDVSLGETELEIDLGNGARQDKADLRVINMIDNRSVDLPVDGQVVWRFRPQVHPEDPARVQELLRELGLDALPEQQRMERLLELLEKDISRVEQAYKRVRVDLNLTTLSLYVGPIAPRPTRLDRRYGPWLSHDWLEGSGGWLGAGDARLGRKKRFKAFIEHYRGLLGLISTFAVAHHGADPDNEYFFDAGGQTIHNSAVHLRPSLAVVGADTAKYRGSHPGPKLVRRLDAADIPIAVVGPATSTTLREELCFPGC